MADRMATPARRRGWWLRVAAGVLLAHGGVLHPAAAGEDVQPVRSAEAMLADEGLLSRLAIGEMRRFRFADAPVSRAQTVVRDAAGQPRVLAAATGRLVLVAFWASWCAPCRNELPSLERLQARIGRERLEVVAVSIDKSADAAGRALASWGVQALPLHHDAGAHAAAALDVPGVPMTLLLDPEGREIGRLRGSAVWDSVEAILLVEAASSRVINVKTPPSAPSESARPEARR